MSVKTKEQGQTIKGISDSFENILKALVKTRKDK